jgi:hypothetical protein
LVLQDQVGLIVDAEGQPTRSALTFPSLPAAIAATGLFVVAAAQEVRIGLPEGSTGRKAIEWTMCLCTYVHWIARGLERPSNGRCACAHIHMDGHVH